MTDFQEEITILIANLRKGIQEPDPTASQFLSGLFSKSEIHEFSKRLAVKDSILKRLRAEGNVSFYAVGEECRCSTELVGRVWRAIRDQYPPAQSIDDRFRVAIPKEERAQLLVENILMQSGFRMDPRTEVLIDMQRNEQPISYRVVRGRDIPVYLKAGVVQSGFLGNDKIVEVQSEARENRHAPVELDIKEEFAVNAFRMCLAVPKESSIKTFADLNDKTIATSYVSTLKQILAHKKVKPRKILYLSGGIEEACKDLGADAIMDIVETGGSLRRNNLIVLENPLYEGNMSFIALVPTERRPENEWALGNFARRLRQAKTLKVA